MISIKGSERFAADVVAFLANVFNRHYRIICRSGSDYYSLEPQYIGSSEGAFVRLRFVELLGKEAGGQFKFMPQEPPGFLDGEAVMPADLYGRIIASGGDESLIRESIRCSQEGWCNV